MKLEGIYAPIPTPVKNGEIAYGELQGNLVKWADTELAGLVVLGSNGEFVFLDEDEKVQMVKFVRDYFPGNKPVIAGTGCESTKATIRLTQKCSEAGADAALVLTPSYFKGSMTPAALEGFYADVADASPVPIVLYNMPRNTGVNLSSQVVAALSRHPNIIGIKDSSGNITQIAETIGRSEPGFSVFAGSGSFLYTSLVLGATGGTLAVANILPGKCHRILQFHREGKAEEAVKLQFEILEANAAVTSRWGVAGLKAAMDMVGYYGGGPIKPLLPLPREQRDELKTILERVGLLS